MLVLSRRHGESVKIGPDIVVTIVRLGSGSVGLGIEAPPEVLVLRDEVPNEGTERNERKPAKHDKPLDVERQEQRIKRARKFAQYRKRGSRRPL